MRNFQKIKELTDYSNLDEPDTPLISVEKWRQLCDDLLNTLKAAQRERPSLRDKPFIYGEPAFVTFERQEMHKAVCRERASRGLKAVPISRIMRAERMAYGHSDYSSKYALYCAEIVVEPGLVD